MFVREYLGEASRRTGENLRRLVRGEMIPSELDENAKQRQKEIQELQKLLF